MSFITIPYMSILIPQYLTLSHPEWKMPIIVTNITASIYAITANNHSRPFIVPVDEVGNLILTLRQAGFHGGENLENNSQKSMARTPEVETKVFDIDPKSIRTKLKELGAQQIFKGQLIAQWIKIGALTDHKLRVRSENELVVVEHKVRSWTASIHKSCIETWFRTKSIDLVLKVFQDVGFILADPKSQKDREIYTLWGIHFVLDHYTNLDGHDIPWLLEVEGTCDSEVESGLKLLWLERDVQRWNWWPMDIVHYYNSKEE